MLVDRALADPYLLGQPIHYQPFIAFLAQEPFRFLQDQLLPLGALALPQ